MRIIRPITSKRKNYMLTKAQMNVGLQQAALPTAAPAVSVFAKAKNLLNSVAVNSKTAKMAIGSIVTAAIVYATFKFATSTTKKADEKKNEQKTTDRVIAKMQEARTAAGKAVTSLSTRAKQFKEEHPVAVKVIGAAVAVGVLGLTAKLLYKPAAPQAPFNDANDPHFCTGDSEDARVDEQPGVFDSKDPFYCTGDSEDARVDERNAEADAAGPEFGPDYFNPGTAAEQEAAKNSFINKFYAQRDEADFKADDRFAPSIRLQGDIHGEDRYNAQVKTPAPAPALHKAAVERQIAQEANALAKDYAPTDVENRGLDEMLDAQEKGARNLQKASDKAWVNSFLGEDLDARIAAEKVAIKAAENEVRAQDSQSFFDKMLSRALGEAAVNEANADA